MRGIVLQQINKTNLVLVYLLYIQHQAKVVKIYLAVKEIIPSLSVICSVWLSHCQNAIFSFHMSIVQDSESYLHNIKLIGSNSVICSAVSSFLLGLGVLHHRTRYAQRAQTSAEHGNPEDPDFGLWTPGSES